MKRDWSLWVIASVSSWLPGERASSRRTGRVLQKATTKSTRFRFRGSDVSASSMSEPYAPRRSEATRPYLMPQTPSPPGEERFRKQCLGRLRITCRRDIVQTYTPRNTRDEADGNTIIFSYHVPNPRIPTNSTSSTFEPLNPKPYSKP